MAYKVHMNNGSVITIANAATSKKDGSGLYLFDADGNEIASFADGTASAAYPADSEITAPPAPVTPEE